MNPFQRLPNEIIDAIFKDMHPIEVWEFQKSAKSSERALDAHLQTRPYGLDELMGFGCVHGINQVIRKAVSLGADVNIIRSPGSRPSKCWTILAASRQLHSVTLLFDLGARLDVDLSEIPDRDRRNFQRQQSPKFFKLCSDRGVRDQFLDFQDCLDHCLFDLLPTPSASYLRYREPYLGWTIDSISMLMELGANPTAWTEEHSPETALAYLIEHMEEDYLAQSGLPILELLLSKQPDVNIQSERLTRDFLENSEHYPESEFCPISAAIKRMASTGSTHIMDMLLQSGAELDLPVHANLQPLVVYAVVVKTPDKPGFDYLIRHGANFEQVWHPEEPVQACDSIPIFRVCEYWALRPLILEDGKFGVINLFIERGGLKNVAIPFIKDALRPMMSLDHEGTLPFIVIGRYHFLLKLVLQDGNLNPDLPQEIDDLLLEIVEEATVRSTGERRSLKFSNIVDPVTVALLLERGAKLNRRVLKHGWWTTQDVRNDVASKLKEKPYFIACNI
ncbi:hypothetical protein NW752_008550 [Fusarium irregulare]|uniref:Uncharacterized protein n=1 Tax=Fusarium irregulare TaxID=2494466 RepID=A0A9W8UDT5_9HYPO|nr:hypothetical protein NW752_008550 [Fusarium irregulare]KAJ4020480.1 hypothetical protein NW766_001967 [Fusarium irregulare]